jgi:DNA end-binding protein Ku
MARAFWKGVISFGMVAIPVRMSLATERKTPSFHLLHKKCLTRPRQVLFCEQDDEYFSIKQTVRGFEYAKDQFVVLSDADFEKVPVKTSHAINIQAFVEEKEIDPLYYTDSHYLEPEEPGAKPFRLLHETLGKAKRVDIAKVSFQKREHLCCLRPFDGILLLQTMHFQDEILPRPTMPEASFTAQEAEMAAALVKVMSKPFKPEEYKDDYQAALQKVIEAKIKGEKTVAPRAPKAEVGDIMAALRASIAAAHKDKVPAGAR